MGAGDPGSNAFDTPRARNARFATRTSGILLIIFLRRRFC